MHESPARLLREFHRTFGLPHRATPGMPPPQLAEMRQRLLDEEVGELADAVRSGELEKIAHELADVVYVAYGTALTYGVDLDAVIAEIHRSNLTKLDRDGRPLHRDDGKVARSDRYRPPDIAGVLHGRETPAPTEGRRRPDVTVRIADRRDVTKLAALRRAWTAERDGDPVDDGFDDRFAEWYVAEEGRRICWIAEVGGDAVGTVNLAVFERMPRPGRPASRWGYLGNAFVLAEYRGQGIGEQLVTPLIDYADEHRLVRVLLSPSARSVPLYERLGFGSAHMLMARVRESGNRPVH